MYDKENFNFYIKKINEQQYQILQYLEGIFEKEMNLILSYLKKDYLNL